MPMPRSIVMARPASLRAFVRATLIDRCSMQATQSLQQPVRRKALRHQRARKLDV